LIVSKDATDKVSLSNTSVAFGLFPWSPSWGEINFRAFDMPTIEFHNELYGRLQEVQNAWKETVFETFLQSKGVSKTKQWIKVNNGNVLSPYDITLLTYIRNSIHHPENTHNGIFTDNELKASIETMISLIESSGCC
jgi:hypothetical protein